MTGFAVVPPRYNPVPVIRLSFALRAAIFAGIGMASASGIGSILGFILGAL